MSDALAIQNVSHSFGRVPALKDVSLSVPRGGFTALLGVNGAGKTTLFSLITRLYNNASGSITVAGHDLRRAVREGHALISLAQRLSSHFALRVVEEEPDVQYPAAFLANDRDGYLYRPIATRFEASASLRDPARSRQLLAYFDEVWERARPASELRPL